MINQIVAFTQARAKAAARRAAVSAASLLAAGAFALAAAAGLFAALFFWVEQGLGPIAAGLICAGAAIVLSIVSLVPLMFRRRPPPPPADPILPQFVSLMANTAPKLTPRQLIVTAALLGAALALSARRQNE